MTGSKKTFPKKVKRIEDLATPEFINWLGFVSKALNTAQEKLSKLVDMEQDSSIETTDPETLRVMKIAAQSALIQTAIFCGLKYGNVDNGYELTEELIEG